MNDARVIHLVAHRGNAAECPENTLPAFQSALGLGARFLELDVHLARDGVPVVIHDHLLARTTGLPGTVFEHDAAELAAMEAGEPARFGEAFRGTRLPLLADVVALLATRPEVTLFVELKRASLVQHGHDRVVQSVLEAIGPHRSQCVLISFDLPAVHRARQLGAASVGWVLSAYDEHTRLKCEALQPDFLFCNHERLPPTGRLWPGPWRWALYEVRDAALALALAARGAAFLETMAVRDLATALRMQRDGA